MSPQRPSWVIYLSAIRWSGPRNRQHELALQLARDRTVLFVEPPGLRPNWRLRIEPAGASIWRVDPLALLPIGRHLAWVNRINRLWEAWRLRRWLGPRGGRRIVLLDEDLAAPLAKRLGASLFIYDAADLDWTFTRRWNRRHLCAALAEGVQAADVVTISSTVLADYLPCVPGPVVELLNACDPVHFTSGAEVPPAVESVAEPRIGYVGALDSRAFDCELVMRIAADHPAWSFVLVGPADLGVASRLQSLPNIHLLGPVSYEDLPGVLNGFDVCLIPYRVGDRIDYVQPKKLFEYLAAGKPVVATPLPALRRLKAPHRLARTAEEFGTAIAAALDDRGEEASRARRASALAHTWELRGRQLRELLDSAEAAA